MQGAPLPPDTLLERLATISRGLDYEDDVQTLNEAVARIKALSTLVAEHVPQWHARRGLPREAFEAIFGREAD